MNLSSFVIRNPQHMETTRFLFFIFFRFFVLFGAIRYPWRLITDYLQSTDLPPKNVK